MTRTVFPDAPRAVMLAGVAELLAPDLDVLWFYLIDGGQTHHHDFITHRPALWASIALIGHALRKTPLFAFGLAGVAHVALDTIVGRVNWGWPLWDLPVTLVTVPATHDWWVMSFLTHWTFAIEIALTALALTIAMRANFGKHP